MPKFKEFLSRFFYIPLGAALIIAALMIGCQDSSEEVSSAAGESESTSSSMAVAVAAGYSGISGERVIFG